MRGTGCSGGVFDVFNPAQAADGYDAIEAIAAQSWVANNCVGMVGLSYAGIAQLYVASTRPPSLAAITPLSVIDDLWRQQWPDSLSLVWWRPTRGHADGYCNLVESPQQQPSRSSHCPVSQRHRQRPQPFPRLRRSLKNGRRISPRIGCRLTVAQPSVE